MILHDDKILDNKEDKVNTLLKAAGLNFPEFYANFFVSNMEGINVAEMLKGVGASAAQGGEGEDEVEEEAEVVEEVKAEEKPAPVKVAMGDFFGGGDSDSDDDSSEGSESS